MRRLLADSNAVVSAHDVNLSIFRPPWLVKSGCFREEELGGDVVVSPVVVQVNTPRFQFVALPNRLQMAFPALSAANKEDLLRVLGGIVRTLPHTPYSACGLNLNYIVTVDQPEFPAWNRRAFASEAADKADATNAKDARFGSYLSFDVLGGRLKLDMKPVRTTQGVEKLSAEWEPNIDVMKLNFNYHYDIGETQPPVDFILGVLAKWDGAITHSESVLERLPS